MTPRVVHCSPDEATRQTGQMLAAACDARLKPVEDLSTMSLGLWEGLLESEIEERYPSTCRLWMDEPSMIHPPKGESFVEAESRLREAMIRILEKPGSGPSAFVLRPLALAMAWRWLMRRPSRDIWPILEQGSGYERILISREVLTALFEEAKAGA